MAEVEEDIVDVDQVVAVVVEVATTSLTPFATTMEFKDMCTVTVVLPEVVKKAIHSITTYLHMTKSITVPLDTMNLMNARLKMAQLNIVAMNVGDGGTITAVITPLVHALLHLTNLYKT